MLAYFELRRALADVPGEEGLGAYIGYFPSVARIVWMAFLHAVPLKNQNLQSVHSDQLQICFVARQWLLRIEWY